MGGRDGKHLSCDHGIEKRHLKNMAIPRMARKIADLFRQRLLSSPGAGKGRAERTTRLELTTLEDRCLLATASSVVAGRAFIDSNRNGLFDAGAERRMAGLTIRLTGNNQGDAIRASVVTKADGSFRFTNVLAGTYTLSGATGLVAGAGLIRLDPLSGGFTTTITVGADKTVTRNLGFNRLAPLYVSRAALAAPFGPGGSGVIDVSHKPTLALDRTLFGKSSSNHTLFAEAGGKTTSINLSAFFDDLDLVHHTFAIHAQVGSGATVTSRVFNIELFDDKTPLTVANFMNYALNNDYDNTVFHRLAKNFVLQGGGFKYNPATKQFEHIPTNGTVQNEFSTNRSNLENTIAMAKVGGDPDSATSEWFINLGNNSGNLDNQNGGFTVFAKLATAADRTKVNDLIAAAGTLVDPSPLDTNPTPDNDGLPINKDKTAANFPNSTTEADLLRITDVELVDNLTYTRIGAVKNLQGKTSNLVTASVSGHQLNLISKADGTTGDVRVTIRATDAQGKFTNTTFTIKVRKAPEVSVALSSPAGEPNKYTATTALSAGTNSDPDLQFTYVWKVNGAEKKRETTSSLTSTFDQSQLGSPGGLVTVQVTPSYRNLNGSPVTEAQVRENTTAILTVKPTDPSAFGATPTYTLVGGADQALFTINQTTGALSFASGRDFEAPSDVGANNVYEVTVQVVGTNNKTETQKSSVQVVNDLAITSGFTANVAENTTAVTTVTTTSAEGGVTFSVTGGADQGKFQINPNSGALTFITAPDFEVPTDSGADNHYVVTVTATDGNGGTFSQTINVTVTNTLAITSAATVSVEENKTDTGLTVIAATTDATPIQFSVSGGADASKFDIDKDTGKLTFKTAPNFEAKGSAAHNNTYVVIVKATDGGGAAGSVTQTITVTVTDNLKFTSSATPPGVVENTTDVTTVVATSSEGTVKYSISGGADQAKFTIDQNTGKLTFKTAPNFEAPGSAAGSNTYLVTVKATDGQGSATQNITVTVTNAEVTFTSSPTPPSVAENATSKVLTVVADSSETGSPKYSITGGLDKLKFSINQDTGDLFFSPPPDFDNPSDSDGNNQYVVEVTANDGAGGTKVQSITVTVTNVNEAPTVANAIPNQTFNGSGSKSFQFAANTFADQDQNPADTLTYSATLDNGNPLPAWLHFDPATRTFSGNPSSADQASPLNVKVTANDGHGGTVSDTFVLTVTNANDTPTVANAIADQTFDGSGTKTFTFADNVFADGDLDTLTYSATLDNDSALPAWLHFDSATRTFSGDPDTADEASPLNIKLTANDSHGGTVSDNFVLTVTNAAG
jgi:cyclophilin family peptidyl-prolyl cis-trans isomerase